MAKHISEQYDLELAQVRERLMEMGGIVESQVNNSCTALVTHDLDMAEEVRDVEANLNQFEVELDDLCVSIIAKRQPTARDLRTVVSVMKVITDLERIGDEADRIARMALDLANSEIPTDHYADFRSLHTNAVKMLKRALDAFARLDIEMALRVIEDDELIDNGYDRILRLCSEQMQSNPTEVERLLRLMWSARAVERIGDHAKNIGEYVIYLVKGRDVRHTPLSDADILA
ncbi:MAG: phosphate signaling complex protein PhoU [Pseudomonadota bacterium]|nr:phosphate signaling complex protein PhoU [Pseudomonadales bacterium]MEC7078046.1 phosphate signaling complex protein PhoU [Pseudomonadota bacterium]MEC7106713.1 phosphate signaling complex protein PhoU [Pseudomonadota bacterium]MEC7251421.1 phosphate signaling complex protein PhoU [Pseudomonadota bacterium]MEC7379851.1 phosphate signaling complex protein PhoU [Pseudomonadota bacterium]|tara:strand:- start:110 stop:802 length:693 start_codon:yes stop_codon:yes gene_type:complete